MTENKPDLDTVHVDLPPYFFDHYAPYATVFIEWALEEPEVVAYVHRKIGDTYLGHFMVPVPRYNTMAMVEGGDLIGVDVNATGVFQIIGYEPTNQDVRDFFNQQIH